MLPGTYGQRGLSARCTVLSKTQGVGSFSVSWAWMCLVMSHVALVSVAIPTAVMISPGAVQPASAAAPIAKATSWPRRRDVRGMAVADGPGRRAHRSARGRTEDHPRRRYRALSVNKPPDPRPGRNTMCTSAHPAPVVARARVGSLARSARLTFLLQERVHGFESIAHPQPSAGVQRGIGARGLGDRRRRPCRFGARPWRRRTAWW